LLFPQLSLSDFSVAQKYCVLTQMLLLNLHFLRSSGLLHSFSDLSAQTRAEDRQCVKSELSLPMISHVVVGSDPAQGTHVLAMSHSRTFNVVHGSSVGAAVGFKVGGNDGAYVSPGPRGWVGCSVAM